MQVTRFWTLAEANAARPRVEEMVAECRAILDEVRGHRDAVEDLRILWGDRLHDPQNPDHAAFRQHLHSFEEAKGRLQDALERFQDQGIFLKDLHQGLVDFPAQWGKDEVFLCYRVGEPAVGHWHPLDGGFAQRRPVPELAAWQQP
jgi:hypothetical protein